MLLIRDSGNHTDVAVIGMDIISVFCCRHESFVLIDRPKYCCGKSNVKTYKY
jgi:hypothetical protein